MIQIVAMLQDNSVSKLLILDKNDRYIKVTVCLLKYFGSK